MTRPIEILLVEDSLGDAKLTMKALSRGKVRSRVHHVKDGVAALDFLHRSDDGLEAGRPDLILLDLNLPRKDGREVLAEVKADECLKQIPVVVLTTSRSEEDVARSYELHANCYITKPVDLTSFLDVVSLIDRFWFSVVNLPPNHRGPED